MTTEEREALEERIAIVWDGAPSSTPITWAEAEQIAREVSEVLDYEPIRSALGRLLFSAGKD